MANYREILRVHSLGLNKTEIAASEYSAFFESSQSGLREPLFRFSGATRNRVMCSCFLHESIIGRSSYDPILSPPLDFANRKYHVCPETGAIDQLHGVVARNAKIEISSMQSNGDICHIGRWSKMEQSRKRQNKRHHAVSSAV